MSSPRPSITIVRYSAITVLFMSISASALLVLTALEQIGKPDAPSPIFAAFIPALLALIGGIALAAILLGLAQLGDTTAAATEPDVSAAISNLTVVMDEVRVVLANIDRQSRTSFAPPPPAPPSPAPAPHTGDARIEPYLARMVELLEELKELSLLDDSERQFRREQADTDEREIQTTEADRLVEESLRLEQMQQKVEDLLGAFDFDQAFIAANEIAEAFPDNESLQQLKHRVQAERNIFREQSAARLFEEVRLEVERRQWRKALDSVQRLLEKFPDHPKSDRIRMQLRPIQNNAEIEERQEQEQTIQEHINAKRFDEAVEASENLLRRFPDSPQATSLRELIPKLRELAAKESSGSGVGMNAFAS